MGERLIESRGDKKIALSWELANEELKDRRLMHPVLPIGLQHGELIPVSQQRAVFCSHNAKSCNLMGAAPSRIISCSAFRLSSGCTFTPRIASRRR
jgi:hypothetical protein